MTCLTRDLCSDLATATAREWLVVNGLGGFAAGTVSGVLTRRYHGLLFAALAPPLGRTLLLSHLEDSAQLLSALGQPTFSLATVRWGSGAVTGHGHRYLDHFALVDGIPTWTYVLDDALLEKRVFMVHGHNTTYVGYQLVRGRSPVRLCAKILANHRDYHGETRHSPTLSVEQLVDGVSIGQPHSAASVSVRAAQATVALDHTWYRDYHLALEQERGFAGLEDHLCAGQLVLDIQPGQTVWIVASTDRSADLSGHAHWMAHVARRQQILAACPWATTPPLQALVAAADQFVVARPQPGQPDAKTVLAGYPWFSDWGRDTMISLPGLALVTGRPALAASLLQTFAQHAHQGVIPNRFPDAADTPEYNTADATLWMVHAVYQYVNATADHALLRSLWPLLTDIIDWHLRGTHFGLRCDPSDGLLRAGQPGVQVTWMDAKVGSWVVTPRIGKPVEINALWYSALCSLAVLAPAIGQDPARFQLLAGAAGRSFARFVDGAHSPLFDVIDAPDARHADGCDASLRPNQLFAVSLPFSPLAPSLQRAVVDCCTERLWTPRGLRSLAATEPDYHPLYRGDVQRRDGAYHQGTVWAYLLGPFALAHHRVYRDAPLALSYLMPLLDHADEACLGTFGEIFDGAPPHLPRGCMAQAWSVAEWLFAYHALTRPSQAALWPESVTPPLFTREDS